MVDIGENIEKNILCNIFNNIPLLGLNFINSIELSNFIIINFFFCIFKHNRGNKKINTNSLNKIFEKNDNIKDMILIENF